MEFKDSVKKFILIKEGCKSKKKLFATDYGTCSKCGKKLKEEDCSKSGICNKCKKMDEGCKTKGKKLYATIDDETGNVVKEKPRAVQYAEKKAKEKETEKNSKGTKPVKKELPVVDVKVKKPLGYGRKLKGDDDFRKKDKPSFLPSGKTRLTDLETKYDSNDKAQGSAAEHDAELFADKVCEKKSKPMNGAAWKYYKEKYLQAWDKGPEALKMLKKKLSSI